MKYVKDSEKRETETENICTEERFMELKCEKVKVSLIGRKTDCRINRE